MESNIEKLDLMYKTNTIIEAKRLRATTFAIAKLKSCDLMGSNREKPFRIFVYQ